MSSVQRNNLVENESSVAHVLIGTTGTGKSSTIDMFTDRTVYICNSSSSGTKGTEFYRDCSDRRITWVDTQGAQDSDNKDTDDIILSQIFRGLNKRKISCVKIGWMVDKKDKSTPPLQEQAKFINSLRKGGIWDSVAIFCKEGDSKKSIQGALDASKQHGRRKDIPCMNITRLDMIEEDHSALKMLKCYKQCNNNQDHIKKVRYENGWYYKNEIKDKIKNIFRNLKSCKILKQNEKCVKCGEIGDSRGFKTMCHFGKVPQYVHVKSLGHPGRKILKHTGKLLFDHKGRVKENRYHESEEVYGKKSSKNLSYHSGNYIRYHDSSWDSHVGARILLGVMTIGLSETMASGDYPCCKNTDYNSEGCRTKWGCCGKLNENAEGCKTKTITVIDELNERHKCCKMMFPSPGCKSNPKWTCCDQREGVVDCKRKYWSCCNLPQDFEGPQGCEEFYSCCDKPVKYAHTGCKYLCCQGEHTSKGCKPKCFNCKGDWGKEAVNCVKGLHNHQIVVLS